ncbi:MAG TPA: type VI secretion system protein TssL [Sedimenticola thiotaurini]|uniref:Type VI secretion system protein TssL n=1 Tax=Sedimenticola thiotaurini TaxID=1543721 RepID=A0A831W2M8_9GAMM|nr:type VI secretion system protein TssL [Sedimenticola thiotaurini]
MSDDCPKCEEGLPAWLATFADLMSLLMCFFVLLLSFAEIDAVRFKKMAESMKDAFGVQREIPANEIVMGTSVIKQEFSPSTVQEPSPIDEIRQQTTDIEQQNLKVNDAVMDAVARKIQQEVEDQAEQLKEKLKKEIDEGLVTVETEERKIIIRIQEKGSFPSGSASLDHGFEDVMKRISDAVAQAPGRVVVAGHTDNIPISTSRFRSNWELSSARAVSVAHALMKNPAIDPARVVIEGHADTAPLAPNDTPENRALNRRVELIIERGEDREGDETLLIRDPANRPSETVQ